MNATAREDESAAEGWCGDSLPAANGLDQHLAWPVDADLQNAGRIELVTQRAQELDDGRGVAAPAFGCSIVIVDGGVHLVNHRGISRAEGFSSYTDEKSTSRAT